MRTEQIEITYKDQQFIVNPESFDSIVDQITDQLNKESDELIAIEIEEDEIIVSDWLDFEDFENLQDLDTIYEIFDCDPDISLEIISAGVACDVSIDDIDEAYSGEFKSDEDFAKDMAEQLGSIGKDVPWPYTCIDWEQAATELMYDYCSDNDHYFRCL